MIDFATMPGLSAPLRASDDRSRANWPMNDGGNGQRFQARHGFEFLYVRAHGWFHYDGKCWTREGAEALALRAAEETALAIKDEARALIAVALRTEAATNAAGIPQDERPHGMPPELMKKKAEQLFRWARTSGSIARAKGMLSFAAARLECTLEDFDRDPYALNCQNGTLRFARDAHDRWQAELHPHNPADRISRICAFAFKAETAAPVWEAHLKRSFPDGRERRFLMRCLGYSSLGTTDEQAFCIHQGRGGDGKSVTMGAIRRVLGSYAAKVDVKTFLEDKKGRSAAQASPDIARLAGATRFATASEPPKGAKLNEALVKEFTGGTPLLARHLNKDPFEFSPCFKLHIDCNALPGVGGADDGIWRRIVLIPWRQQLKRNEMDPRIEDKIVEEGEGVLATLVVGALNYLDHRGFSMPDSIRAAHSDYKSGSNPFRDWFDTWCVAEPEHECRQGLLYSSYKEEMERLGNEYPMSAISFGKALDDMQVGKDRDRENQVTRRGVRLLSDEERAARTHPPSDVAEDLRERPSIESSIERSAA